MNDKGLEKLDLADLIKQPSELVDDHSKPVSQRTMTRRAAVQALYHWTLNPQDTYLIEKQFYEEGWLGGVDRVWFKDILNKVTENVTTLDAVYAPFLDRSVKLINPVERCILRLAVYELQDQIQVPSKVIINEAVELTKYFGAEDSHKYINGVTDKVAKQVRPAEFDA
ncbi:transcription antitermination factor NusB [Thiomicrospira sp. ALE5]|uniref:transcription antitermination factor NusB n=1 Tax=Thiomicrospira sp. ALE5 TaxID=748650 RepID=UPI0008E77F20|nr:transcription antitermination factor NusB [Thiomicrospira sp. ALE5]SFR51242.1 NusB antitermination factor [Thiomicrospira sp. ALE5]